MSSSPSLSGRLVVLLARLALLLGICLTGLVARPVWAQEDGGDGIIDKKVFLPLMAVTRAAEPFQPIAFTYRLQEGDDLAILAIEWGVDSELLACVTRSGLEPLSSLRPGQLILIANPRYRCHIVQPGESVVQIAAQYEMDPAVLVADDWNKLLSADDALAVGRRILVLDGKRPDLQALREEPDAAAMTPTPTSLPMAAFYGDGHFLWPVDGGVITQGYRAGHRALDIGAALGTAIFAADNGIVLKSGYGTDGYGGRVIIDHQNDYVTLYAHLSQSLVEAGDKVQKGQVIGYVGSTGNSTGPHLHFEIRDFGYLANPMELLDAR